MIKKIQVANYKSIDKLEFELGRINVLIGENGAGKSNILEAIALAGAAAADKLDNEFLTSRGIRVTRPEYMRPAFPGLQSLAKIEVGIGASKSDFFLAKLNNDNVPYSKWEAEIKMILNINDTNKYSAHHVPVETVEIYTSCTNSMNTVRVETNLSIYINNFILYSPENSALRTFQREGQIEPLGINGEGLLKLLSVLSRPEYSESLNEIINSLQILGWFEDLTLTDTDPFAGSRIQIKDRYLDETRRYFDQLSTNEGFLFLLFYFALFSTDLTPKFFAIDNIDASLNPKLCEKLMRELVSLAEKHDKQVIFTTHNPAILDGLNLDDDEQRLFVVSRNKNGATRLKRVNKPVTPTGERPTRLSELFLRGVLGGLPKGF